MAMASIIHRLHHTPTMHALHFWNIMNESNSLFTFLAIPGGHHDYIGETSLRNWLSGDNNEQMIRIRSHHEVANKQHIQHAIWAKFSQKQQPIPRMREIFQTESIQYQWSFPTLHLSKGRYFLCKVQETSIHWLSIGSAELLKRSRQISRSA